MLFGKKNLLELVKNEVQENKCVNILENSLVDFIVQRFLVMKEFYVIEGEVRCLEEIV